MPETPNLRQAILFKTEKKHSEYRLELESQGFQVHFVPVLRFKNINQEELLQQLHRPDAFSGLIVTSQQSLQTLQQLACLDNSSSRVGTGSISEETALSVTERSEQNFRGNLLKAWQNSDKHFFTVGPATQAKAEMLGFDACTCHNAPRGAVLADKIVEILSTGSNSVPNRPLLYIGALNRRPEISNKLDHHNISYREVDIYESLVREDLLISIDMILEKIRLATTSSIWFVFFSPSGVRAVCQRVDSKSFEQKQVRFASIGPTTGSAIHKSGLVVSAEAPMPDASNLVSEILSVESKKAEKECRNG